MKIILFISICPLYKCKMSAYQVQDSRKIDFSILVLSYSKILAISIEYISIHSAKYLRKSWSIYLQI